MSSGAGPDGRLVTAKLLSEDPEHYPDAAVEGIRRLLGLDADAPITPAQVEVVKMGTTVATNALLERKGEPLLLVVTRGFGDALRIAYQNRPRLFDRRIELPELLYREVLEIDERLAADGEVIKPLELGAARAGLQQAYDGGLRAVAILLMHGYKYAAHERALAA
jgi:5-oxoprolinase (ATP-hydrolysing)